MQSDYNPMEEPSWLQPAESSLAGEGTPTSALTATTGVAASTGQGLPVGAQEVASFAPEGCAALDSVDTANAAQDAAGPAAEPAPATELPDPVPFGSQRSGDHMVWTNEDGDIDALPWDMAGWSTGSSSERGSQEQPQQLQQPQQQSQQQQQQPPQQQQRSALTATAEQEQRQPGDPVDEDALIGALRRKVRPDLPMRSTRRNVLFCQVKGGIKAALCTCLRVGCNAVGSSRLQTVFKCCAAVIFFCRPGTICVPRWLCLRKATTSPQCMPRRLHPRCLTLSRCRLCQAAPA